MVLPSMEFLLFNTMEPIVNRRAVLLCGKTSLYDKSLLCDFSKRLTLRILFLQHKRSQPQKQSNMDNLGDIDNIRIDFGPKH
jgi:hypothetical protein